MIDEKAIEAWRERRAREHAEEQYPEDSAADRGIAYLAFIEGARECAEVERLVGRIEALRMIYSQSQDFGKSRCRSLVLREWNEASVALAALLGKAGA